MKTKKIISLLLILAMSLGLLAGCGKKRKEVVRVEELVDEKVTLTVGIPQNGKVTSYEDNALTEWLEEQANCEIEFHYFSNTTSEYKQQIALLASANSEMPDIITSVEFDSFLAGDYGEDGYFLDLTDYINAYAPNYQEAYKNGLTDQQKTYLESIISNQWDGATYGMPFVASDAMDQLQSIMYINKEWLDTLNLPIPTTVEELRSTLKAFKEKDPNGNGQADEIPMIGSQNVNAYLINAFVLYDHGDFSVTDGKVWDPVMTDEYREAVIYANKLVQEGLYSKQSFSIKTSAEHKQYVTAPYGPCRVGVFEGHHELKTQAEPDVLDQFVALPALSDATGKGGHTVVKPRSIYFAGFITKDCEYPANAMKLLDAFYSAEAQARQRHGAEGVDWERAEGQTPYGTPGHIKIINSEAYFSGNSTWCNRLVLGIFDIENFIAISTDAKGRIGEANRLQKEQWEIYTSDARVKEVASQLVYTDEEYEVREIKLTDCQSYIANETVKFIAGENDPTNDSSWDAFLSQIKALGREELMDITQDAYDRMYK